VKDLIGDARYRVHKSVKLWVVTGRTLSGREIFGIQEPIQRVVHHIIGYGKYVQYQNWVHKLHPIEECKEAINRALRGELEIYSNWHGISYPEYIEEVGLTPAPFIYEHEMGLQKN